jgi:pectate lyase
VFLFSLCAASFLISGCTGMASSSNPNTSPAPQPAVAQLKVSPGVVSVSTVVGTPGTQTITASNPGSSPVSISQASVSGTGFTTAGLTTPLSIAPGATTTFSVAFTAATPGSVTGKLSLMTTASSTPIVVQLAATANPAPPSSSPTPPTATSVTVSPATVSIATGGSITFTAAVQGPATNTSVTWAASSGAITSAGVYTAPASVGTATITATSVADTSKFATASVTIAAASVTSISVSPTSASTATNGTLQFHDTLSGSVSNPSVTWTAARGTINSSGAYTAPTSAGNDTVTVTSVADATKFATATVTVSAPVSSGALPAFPGAQGGGAASAGGRGGSVIEVTNLKDSGDGSLRACLSASGPRTCVFRVAGIITPQTQLRVENPFVTIACQTAPGEVILGGPGIPGESLFITTHDVTVRYCTFSGDNINVTAGPDTGTMNIEIADGDDYNIILDHLTTRWAGNKLWATVSNYVGPNRLITTQWSMFYEPNTNHAVGPGNGTNPGCVATSGSPCFSSGEHDIDFHHDLFVNISHRIPESTNHSTRFVNNIIYNWDFYASEWLGAMTVDEIGNKYVAGNLNAGSQKHEIHFTTDSPPLPGTPSAYLSGNVGPNLSDPSGNQYLMAAQVAGENGEEQGSLPSSWIRSSPMPAPAFPINADPVGDLDAVMLGSVGNSRHLDCSGNWVGHRDAADARIVAQYQNRGSGGYWPNAVTAVLSSLPAPKSDWTDQPLTGFSACTESLHDGIPDQWKSAQGLSTTDPNLYKSTAPNGYTYLENYLNGPQ